MRYPNVTLRIKNEQVAIELQTEEGKVKRIAKADMGLDTLLMQAADIVGGTYSQDVWTQIREADNFLLLFPEQDLTQTDVQLASLLEVVQTEAGNYLNSKLTDTLQLNDALKQQLLEDWRLDVLASLVEEVYSNLIARTVFLASELGIGDIYLADERLEPRLRELMSAQLLEVGVELFVI